MIDNGADIDVGAVGVVGRAAAAGREVVRVFSSLLTAHIAAPLLQWQFSRPTHTLRPWNGVICCAATGAAQKSAAATASASTARAGPSAAAGLISCDRCHSGILTLGNQNLEEQRPAGSAA